MRDALDAVLAFIGAASLNDTEWALVDSKLDDLGDDVKTHGVLDDVLKSRDSVSSRRDRLRWYYLAKGAAIGALSKANSNILIGAGL